MAAAGEWMNTKDAATLLGITTRRLYRFIDEGQVRAHRFGRVIRLERAEVEAFKASGAVDRALRSRDDPDDPDGGVAAIIRV